MNILTKRSASQICFPSFFEKFSGTNKPFFNLKIGDDPGRKAVEQRRAERESETVTELIDLYINLHARPKKRSWREDQKALQANAIPAWGHRKTRDITRRDIVALLDKITARGSPIMANRMKSVLHRLFRFAIARDFIQINPVASVEANKETPRDRTLNDEEIERFLV